MIRYALKCSEGHGFDSWFESSDAYETLAERGLLSCPECGCSHVQKAIMAPGLGVSGDAELAARAPDPAAPAAGPASDTAAATSTDPGTLHTQALARFKAHVEANSDYVGRDFAKAARDMHEGLTPERSIHGEARPEEARKLIEDGVPVAPLPFIPTRKVN